MRIHVCQCADPGCPVHRGLSPCSEVTTREYPRLTRVYRIDQVDLTGTPMCQPCAEDAMASGVFGVRR